MRVRYSEIAHPPTVARGQAAGDRAAAGTRGRFTGRSPLKGLGEKIATAHDLVIAAAFYDETFCKKLLSFAGPGLRRVRLIFNGLGGTRLLYQRDQLVKLQRELRARGKTAEIRLGFERGMFHTKLIVAHSKRSSIAFIGSANATMAAMEANEEILIEVPAGKRVEGYVDRIWDHATSLDDLDEKLTARSLIAFFRSGSLYFKPTTQLQTTFSPFTKLIAELDTRERKKLGTAVLPSADQETGIGPFNLKLAIGYKEPSKGAKKPFEKTPDSERSNASIKPFAIETCFGYWVPRAAEEPLGKMLREVGNTKRKRLLELRATFESVGKTAVARKFTAYTDAVWTFLDDARVAIPPGYTRGEAPAPFEAFYERVRRLLTDDAYIDRLCAPFVSGPMPELWNDALAYDEFKTSYFEYVEFIGHRHGRTPHVPGALLRELAVDERRASATELKSALEAKLKATGWTDRDWRFPPSEPR